jgi:hypothetical protein
MGKLPNSAVKLLTDVAKVTYLRGKLPTVVAQLPTVMMKFPSFNKFAMFLAPKLSSRAPNVSLDTKIVLSGYFFGAP